MSLNSKYEKTIKFLREGRFDMIVYEVKKFFGYRELPLPFPSNLMIEPSNICNLKCPTCPCGNGRDKRPKRFMKFQEFQSIIDQSREKTKMIQFFNYGEPFTNPDACKMIKYAVDAGIKVTTSTNGMFFDSTKICEEIVESGLDEIILCLDGTDQQTLEIFRKGADMRKILNGFEILKQVKSNLNSQTPRIILQFILMKHNINQKDNVFDFAKKIGADTFSLKSCGISTDEPNFEQLAEDFLPNEDRSNRYIKNFSGEWVLKGQIKNQCNKILNSVVISSDGSVLPCCYDILSENIMGNVFEQSLSEIWKSKRYKEFRKKIHTNRKSINICCHCPESRVELAEQILLSSVDS